MTPRRAVTALLFVQLIALGAAAQQSAEFGRGTGGEIVLTPKGAAPFSGSLELSLGTSPSYGVTAGGTLLQDRLWFFAGASRLPENAVAGALGARVNGRIAEGHDFSAFLETARRPSAFGGIAPSSFLSLRYTGVLSSNMLVSGTFTRSH